VAAATAAAATEVASLGPDLWNDSYYPAGADAAAVRKPWFVIDAEGQTLGRLASLAAAAIRGKGTVEYTPSMDMGAFVVVVNAELVAVTGRKETDKTYFQHSNGRPGKYKLEPLRELRARVPERVIESAVKGMLPKGRIGGRLFQHLKVYKGGAHPHGAQRPLDITGRISKKPTEIGKL
jgi:large subunit ribosomal protein L13